ncbi:MAG: hypothetical protein AAGB31_01215 [Bdellovibrio sp.]
MPFTARAEWGVVLGLSGYLGSYYAGASFLSENERHNVDITLGVSPGIIDEEVYQIGARYVYSPFEYQFERFPLKTNILSFGILVTRCLCDDTFVQNLSIYPEHNYYDETAYRFGLVLEHNLKWESFTFFFNWVLLDQIAIASYNNPHIRQRPLDFWSAGLGIRFYPDF